jgi:hypothetical protein
LHPEQKKIFQSMTAEQKLKVSEMLFWSARALKRAALRAHHRNWDEEKIEQAVKESFLYARH